jgi:3',5'-cyclic AMP phosphodiesterase CpdA
VTEPGPATCSTTSEGLEALIKEDSMKWSILHLSDTQFGQFHQFTSGPDSLASRLLIDLTENLLPAVPPIKLVVLTGDITERALPNEFQQATKFLTALTTHLAVGLENVVVVPGNHDVSWKACEAHFNDRESRGQAPVPPYSPKWKYYQSFQKKLSGDRSEYSVRHLPEMNLSLACLNSTFRESHLEHYGFCGEEQLREVASELGVRGLGLRIALLHHNVRRGPTRDDENLRDELDLTRILGPQIDLVLHGHTHDGRRDHLSNGTLVLSTGSAAVDSRYRPEEVGNQYQLLTVSGDQLKRWARRYQPTEKRFVPDGRVGSEEHPGTETITMNGTHRQRTSENREPQLSRLAHLRLGLYASGDEQLGVSE